METWTFLFYSLFAFCESKWFSSGGTRVLFGFVLFFLFVCADSPRDHVQGNVKSNGVWRLCVRMFACSTTAKQQKGNNKHRWKEHLKKKKKKNSPKGTAHTHTHTHIGIHITLKEKEQRFFFFPLRSSATSFIRFGFGMEERGEKKRTPWGSNPRPHG